MYTAKARVLCRILTVFMVVVVIGFAVAPHMALSSEAAPYSQPMEAEPSSTEQPIETEPQQEPTEPTPEPEEPTPESEEPTPEPEEVETPDIQEGEQDETEGEQPDGEPDEEPDIQEVEPDYVLLDANTVIVYDYAELKGALANDNGINYVYLGADITMETAGIIIHASKPSVTVDGFYPPDGVKRTLTDAPSNLQSATINIRLANNVTKSLTIKNLNIDGKNYFGPFTVYDGRTGVTVMYENVHYTGPGLVFNRDGLTRFRGTNHVEAAPGHAAIFRAMVETNKVEIGGHATFINNYPYFTVFYLVKSNITFDVLSNARVKVVLSDKELIYNEVSQPVFTIGENAVVDFETGRGMFYNADASMQAKSVTIENGAKVYISQAIATLIPTLRISGNLTLGKGATLYMKNTAGSSVVPVIRFTAANATAYFNDPSSVVLYNPSGSVIQWNLSGGMQIDSEFLNMWKTAAPLPGAGGLNDPPLRSWYKADGSNLSVITSGTAVSSSNHMDTEPGGPLNSATLELSSARVLAMGRLPLTVNEITNQTLRVSGMSAPNARVYMETMQPGGLVSLETTADGSGYYAFDLPYTLEAGSEVTLKSNFEFKTKTITATVILTGELSFKTFPEQIVFPTVPISADGTLIERGGAMEIVISDTRETTSGFDLRVSLQAPLSVFDTDLTLPGAVLYVDEQGHRYTLGADEMFIHHGDAKGDTALSWPQNGGILLKHLPQLAHTDVTYAAILVWTLVDAP